MERNAAFLCLQLETGGSFVFPLLTSDSEDTHIISPSLNYCLNQKCFQMIWVIAIKNSELFFKFNFK